MLTVLVCLFSTSNRTHADTLYVENQGNNTIVKIDSSGNASVFASSGLSRPEGLAFDSSGNLYVANQQSGTIEKFDPSGQPSVFASQLPPTIGSMTPLGLAFDNSGNLYVVDESRAYGRILKFDPNGNASVFASGGLLSGNGGYGLTIGPDGDLYVANRFNNSVVRFDTNGVGSVFASPVYPKSDNPPIGNSPVALAFDSSGNLYVGDDSSGTIVKFGPSGTGSLFAAVGWLGGGGDISGLAIDSSGNLYTSTYGKNFVAKWDPSGHGSIFANASDGLNGPGFIAVQIPEPSSFLLATVGALLLWPLLKRNRPESDSRTLSPS
jgi:DNA-binding beta-propeller fold protein YncE